MNLYHTTLMDHYRNPRHRGTITDPDFSCTVDNPTCGDTVSVQGCVREGILSDVAFTGSGCVISQAAASLLMQHILHTRVHEVQALTKDTMLTLVEIPLGPIRIRCALLALEAVQQGIAQYHQRVE